MAKRAESQTGYISGFSTFSAAERRNMSETHGHQAIPLLEGETPNCINAHTINVLSGSMCKQALEKTQIFKKYDLFESKILIIKQLESMTVDYIVIDESMSGFKADYTINGKDDAVFERGDYIVENESIDGIIAIGKNARIALKMHENTFEDMIQVSRSFADNTEHLESKVYDIHITEDYEFVNLSENPDIFVPIKPYADGKLLITRKRSEINFNSFSKVNLNKDDQLRNHKEYEGYGETDVKVYMNKAILKTAQSTRTWDWLKERHLENIAYHTQFIEEIRELLAAGFTLTENMFNLTNYYVDFCNGFSMLEKHDLSCLVRIVTEKSVKLKDGSKLTNLYGTKGLLRIAEDNLMPYLEDGTVIDIVINSNTVIGRQNLGQIREMEFNELRELFERRIKSASTFDEKMVIFREFMIKVCKADYDFSSITTDFFDHKLFKLIGIFENFDEDLVVEYDVDIAKTLYNPETKQPYRNKANVGFNYVFQLKHEPEKKSSAVALPYESKAGFPVRSAKRDYLVIGDKPSNMGYMEINHLANSGTEILDELIKIRSYSKTTREALALAMVKNDLDILQADIPLYSNSSKEFFKQILKCLGINLGL